MRVKAKAKQSIYIYTYLSSERGKCLRLNVCMKCAMVMNAPKGRRHPRRPHHILKSESVKKTTFIVAPPGRGDERGGVNKGNTVDASERIESGSRWTERTSYE